MKRIVFLLVTVALSFAAFAEKHLKVLAIGNSFSQSVLTWLPQAVSNYPGCKLDMVNLMIGGCPLKRHWENVEKAADPEYRPYGVSVKWSSGPSPFPKKANIPEILAAEKWDIVTVQQASGQSAFSDTYEPYAGKLIAFIRERAPQAEIRVHQTWAYAPADPRLDSWRFTQRDMYENLRKAYAKLAADYALKTIPVGDAVQLYREKLPAVWPADFPSREEYRTWTEPRAPSFGDDPVGNASWRVPRKSKDGKRALVVDGAHLNAAGKYLQACVWLGALFDVDVTKLAWKPDLPSLDERKAACMRACAAEVLAATARPAAPYVDGERVVFLGDSITHNAFWCAAVSDYYYTRFPERAVHFHNAGVGGDTAGGCMRRIAEDVTPWKPTAMTVMFGMNDARIAWYNGTNSTPNQIAEREAAIPVFRTAMESLSKRLKTDFPETKITWFAPSPYDETVKNRYIGANEGLAACAEIVRALVATNGDSLVDMYSPMTAFNLAEQKKDPSFSLCGFDGVHPHVPGGLFMARLLLAAQNAPSLVSSVRIGTNGLLHAENAVVSDFVSKPGELTFTCLEKALPCPVLPLATNLAEKIGFANAFNREMFRVEGLDSGFWRLEIDNRPIVTRTAYEWQQGANLTVGPVTPQMEQAVAVAAANRAVWAIEDRLQNYSALRHFMLNRHLKADRDDWEKVTAFIAANREKPEIKRDYFARFFDQFLTEWPKRAELHAEVESRIAEIRRLAKPVPHRYRLVRVASRDAR